MATARATPSFPRFPLYAAAGMVALALLAAAAGRLLGPVAYPPTGSPVAARNLRFIDNPDGSEGVRDADTGRLIAIMAPGTNGFARATLRGLASQRKREGQGEAVPFHLAAWPDGRLTLDDPGTGRTVDLEAFGRTNAEAFAAWLTAPEPGP